jgi:hypothetical protein
VGERCPRARRSLRHGDARLVVAPSTQIVRHVRYRGSRPCFLTPPPIGASQAIRRIASVVSVIPLDVVTGAVRPIGSARRSSSIVTMTSGVIRFLEPPGENSRLVAPSARRWVGVRSASGPSPVLSRCHSRLFSAVNMASMWAPVSASVERLRFHPFESLNRFTTLIHYKIQQRPRDSDLASAGAPVPRPPRYGCCSGHI